MKLSRIKALSFALALASCSITGVHAQGQTKEGIWMAEYNNTVEQGLYALNAKNFQKAEEKLLKAAKWGSKEAQFYLAQMYLNGWGMEPNYKEGWLWFNVALEQRTKEWRDAERKLKKALPEDFITAMKPLVEERIALYGAEAQDLSCSQRTRTGTNIKEITCEKRAY